MRLHFEMRQGCMVGDHPRALAINVVPPFLDTNDNRKQLSLMRGIVAWSTSEFLAVICDGLQSPTLVLLQDPTYA